MTLVTDKIISIANNEIGYLEKKSKENINDKKANAGTKDYTKYGVWFGSDPGPWCCKFVCWVFNQAGCLSLIRKTAGCSTMMNWFKNNNQYLKNNYIPKKCDIIFINWNKKTSPDHIGIVTKTDSTYVYTVEGNRSNGVFNAKYKLNDQRIIGYGIPKFADVYPTGKYQVISKTYLRVRTGPGTNYPSLKYEELTCNARLQNMELSGKRANGLVNGVTCDVSKVNSNWGKIPSGWICLDYCKRKTD